jgi:uncharacterized 2Fe-2S/4Fe-4S cluster protein (DUF4445 family)
MNTEDEGLITLRPSGRILKGREGATLLELLREQGLVIASGCGGAMKCGKCLVDIEWCSEPLPPPSEQEKALLGHDSHEKRRLACAVSIGGSAIIDLRPGLLADSLQILTGSSGLRDVQPQPSVTLCRVKRKEPEEGGTVFSSISTALRRQCGASKVKADHLVLSALSRMNSEKRLFFALREEKEVISVYCDEAPSLFGIAFDIGTTTIASYLVHLESGRLESVSSCPNPQIPFGDDVVTRITYCLKNEKGTAEMQRLVLQALNSLILELASSAGISTGMIVDSTVVGNTAMHHLLLGLKPKSLSLAPYRPMVSGPMDIKARDLGLAISPSAYVHLLPLVGGYVGSDAVACILASYLSREKTPSLIMDIGTNGEIVLGDGKDIYACSTAAGPAFEGGHIRHGIRAVPGAIDKVELEQGTLRPKVRTIGNAPPIGICGSGVISAAAALVRAGILKPSGALKEEIYPDLIRPGSQGDEFVLVREAESGTGVDIVITESDLSQVQIAKAALCAGATALWERAGRPPIRRTLLAGAGGSSIDPRDAACIGLIPSFASAEVTAVGNAAGKGACLALKNMGIRREAEEIAERVRYVELSGLPLFNDLFVSSMPFRNAPGGEDYD